MGRRRTLFLSDILARPIPVTEPTVAFGNERQFKQMQARLDALSNTGASVTIPLTEHALSMLGVMGAEAHGSYPFAHSVVKHRHNPGIEVHINEVLHARTHQTRYGLVSLIAETRAGPQLGPRYFANAKTLSEIKSQVLPKLGFEVADFAEGQRIHMSVGTDFMFIINQLASFNRPADPGTLECAVYEASEKNLLKLGELVKDLGVGGEVGLGHAAGPVTGAMRVTLNVPGFRVPAPPKDLSIASARDEFQQILGKQATRK